MSSGVGSIEWTDNMPTGFTTWRIGGPSVQVGVKFFASDDGKSVFICSARPRYRAAMSVMGQSQKSVQMIAKAINNSCR